MLSEEQERQAMKGFDYVMQSFNTTYFNKLDQGGRMLDPASLKAAVKKQETARLQVLLRFSKYSLNELKNLFTAIDVEAEAARILAGWNQEKVAA